MSIYNVLAGIHGSKPTISLKISTNTNDVVLQPSLINNSAYWNPPYAGTPTYVAGQSRIVLSILPNVLIGASTTANASLVVTGWSSGDIIDIVNYGIISGRGGDGGVSWEGSGTRTSATSGQPGGPAIKIKALPGNPRYVNISNYGTIQGGGGGGGCGWGQVGYNRGGYGNYSPVRLSGAGGRGGAGVPPGNNGAAAYPATATEPNANTTNAGIRSVVNIRLSYYLLYTNPLWAGWGGSSGGPGQDAPFYFANGGPDWNIFGIQTPGAFYWGYGGGYGSFGAGWPNRDLSRKILNAATTANATKTVTTTGGAFNSVDQFGQQLFYANKWIGLVTNNPAPPASTTTNEANQIVSVSPDGNTLTLLNNVQIPNGYPNSTSASVYICEIQAGGGRYIIGDGSVNWLVPGTRYGPPLWELPGETNF
jgi:hypothetical protein